MFIATLAGAGVFAAFGIDRAGSTQAGRSLVWRLDSHWGYPSGKRGATHCECNACVSHATNKVFATQAAASEGRAHKNCACQMRAVQIRPDGYAALFADGQSSRDLRDGEVAAVYGKSILHAGASS